MSQFDLYYDQIYADKHYAVEAEVVRDVLNEAGQRHVKTILDAGCGTGSHAIELAKNGVQVYGMDTSLDAVEIATRKDTPLCRFYSEWEFIPTGLDGAISLFNVVNYLLTKDALIQFMKEIFDRLDQGAAFTFDCWNLMNLRLHPPRTKYLVLDRGNQAFEITTTPGWSDYFQNVRLTKDIKVTSRDAPPETFTHVIDHRVWETHEIHHALDQAGFNLVEMCHWMRPGVRPHFDDPKFMFIARRLVTY